MSRTDREFNCETCGDAFVWGWREQELYAERGWDPPRRCRGCQDRRDPDPEPEVQDGFAATCSACGTATTLPFVPASDRPVYCDPCFRNR